MSNFDNELYYWQGLGEDDKPCHICHKPIWDCACEPKPDQGEPRKEKE